MRCLTLRGIGSSGIVGDDMNWMEIQTLSLCFIVLILKEMRFCLVRSLPDYESVSDSSVKHSYENAVVVRNEARSVCFLCCIRYLRGWMRLCTMGLKEGFLNNLLFCLRERIYRQVLLDLWVVHVSFGDEFPENFSRPLMYVAATSKRRSNVKPQIIILTSLSRQTGIC